MQVPIVFIADGTLRGSFGLGFFIFLPGSIFAFLSIGLILRKAQVYLASL